VDRVDDHRAEGIVDVIGCPKAVISPLQLSLVGCCSDVDQLVPVLSLDLPFGFQML